MLHWVKKWWREYHLKFAFLNFCCMKIWYNCFLRLSRIHENKTFFYVLMKIRYLNTRFVSLQYKNTNQYWSKYSKKIRGKIPNFLKNIFWFFLAGPALRGPVNKNKQRRTLHCSHATWTVEQPRRGRRRRREVEAYLAVVRSYGSWSCRLYAVGRWFCSFSVLFFLCSFFSPLLSPVSPFLLLLLMVEMSWLMVA